MTAAAGGGERDGVGALCCVAFTYFIMIPEARTLIRSPSIHRARKPNCHTQQSLGRRESTSAQCELGFRLFPTASFFPSVMDSP